MKKALIILPLFFSLSAFAFPEQVYLLSCKSASAEITMNLSASATSGISTSELTVKFAGKTSQAVDNVLTDVPQHSADAPKAFAFYADGKLVSLNLSKDAISASVEQDASAVIAINGNGENAVCTGTQTY